MIEKMLRVVESRFVCSGTSVEAPLYNVVLHSLVAAKEVSANFSAMIIVVCCPIELGSFRLFPRS